MKQKAVYTVEAAWVMAVCISIVMGSILLTFHMYKQTTAELSATTKTVVDAATRFRQIQLGEDVWETITKKEK